MSTVEVTCPPCIQCGESAVLTLQSGEVRQWREGMYAQYAFPTLSAAQREMLISGTHPQCWDQMWRTNEVQSRPPRTI